jgi:hypothetical protein
VARRQLHHHRITLLCLLQLIHSGKVKLVEMMVNFTYLNEDEGPLRWSALL